MAFADFFSLLMPCDVSHRQDFRFLRVRYGRIELSDGADVGDLIGSDLRAGFSDFQSVGKRVIGTLQLACGILALRGCAGNG